MLTSEYMKVVHEKAQHKIVAKIEKILAEEDHLSSQDLEDLKNAAKALWALKECSK